MSKKVIISSIQPPDPVPLGMERRCSHQEMVIKGLELLEETGKKNADISCFPEFFNIYGLEKEASLVELAESYPTPLIQKVQELARRYHMYVILPILERRDNKIFNTALIIDRKGNLIGRYDKTHPTLGEQNEGVEAGEGYPVFSVDFGKIGIMLCNDNYFPEVARILSLNGAEIIFFPHLWGGIEETMTEALIRTRAFDNAVIIVTSTYGLLPPVTWKPGLLYSRSSIIGTDGLILADRGRDVGIVTAEVDLDKPRLICVHTGNNAFHNFRQTILGQRRPETYYKLCERNIRDKKE